ncbi:Cell division cycle 7-related protein kinase [Blattella germanica]|nr:Cell division cycle 7-related protein kinase [Blattella germanica]
MEILPLGMRADYIANAAAHKDDYFVQTSNITKLQESELTQDASFFNKTLETGESTATQSWVDSTQQPPPSNATVEEPSENSIVYERCLVVGLWGADNVIGVDLCLRKSDCVVFVMPYLPHKRFSDYVQHMTVEETREYMLNLFIALRRVHSFNVIHRDIKPSNFLYDRENKNVINEIDDKCSSHQETPVVQKSKRMALQPRTNENMINISRNDTPNSQKLMKHNYWSTETNKCAPENNIHQLGLSPSRNKILGTKNENTPPNSKKTPRHKLLQNEGIRSPLKDSRNLLKHNSIKKKLFCAGSPRVSNTIQADGPKFQTLAPGTPSGPCHVRVQNSQVKSHLVSPPMSTPQQKKLVFSRPSPFTQIHTNKTTPSQKCHCYGKPKVCNVCLLRKVQAAPRAGTPGFRPPEVLLKYPLQTTAVDMWAAGIILLCILSGCYPFFRSPDDLTALAEMMSVFGTEGIRSVAVKLGRMVTCSIEKKAMNLRKLCERLRRHRKAGRPSAPPGAPVCRDCDQVIDIEDGCLCLLPGDNYEPSKKEDSEIRYPSSAFHLLERLLDLNPETRITAAEALEHPFIKGL